MKVLFLTRHFYPMDRPSGVVSLLIEMALSLVEDNHNVSIACIRKKNESDQYTDKHGLNVLKFDQLSPKHLASLVRSERPDKIIVFSSISGGSLMVLWWIWIIVSSGIRDKTVFYQTTNLKVNSISRRLFNLCSRVVWKFAVANRDISSVLDINEGDCKLILPSVNFKRIVKLGGEQKNAKFTVCFMGHLTEVKGADRVVELARRLPSVEFKLIAGFSPGKKNIEFYNDILESIAEMANIVHYPFCDNPIEVLSSCHIMVLPYRSGVTVLGVAQSAIEAMVLGIPLISTANSSVSELLEDGGNGFRCESVDEMEKVLLTLQSDCQLYDGLVANSLQTAETKFNVHNQVKKLIEN